jgi:hypothetical protein
VVAVQESPVQAPGEGAAAVAHHQGPADGRRNAAAAPADVQTLPASTHGQQSAITGHAAQRFRGYVKFRTM